jgi:hypothetical protein
MARAWDEAVGILYKPINLYLGIPKSHGVS